MSEVSRDQLRAEMRDALDARALNLEQERLIYNPSPEPDSIVELVARLASGRPAEEVLEVRRLLRRFIESNAAEGGLECRLAGSIEASLQRHFGARERAEATAA